MKKVLRMFGLVGVALIVGFSVIGCGQSPSKVVSEFLAAINKGDAKKIADLSTPETAAMVTPMLSKVQGSLAEKGGIAKLEQTITGDTATVKVTFKDESTESYNLVKVNGKWKISITK